MTVESNNGEATIKDENLRPLYHVKWQKAQVVASDKGIFATDMDNVQGEFFKDGRVSSRFQGDHARADRLKQLLVITGGVRATSAEQGTDVLCDRLEWHAIEKIARAFGNVRAHGSYGTLIGLNEAWASPDLQEIATPSLLQADMKKTLALTGIALSTASIPQGPVTIKDSSQSLIIRTQDIALSKLPGPVYRFVLAVPGGQVYVSSKKQGVEFYAPKIVVNAISIKGKEADAIRDATATGGVRAIRTAANGKGEITGKSANYVVKGSSASLTVSGPVNLTGSQAGAKNYVASGSSLNADLGSGKSDQPFKTATLQGPVQIRIHQAPQGKAQQGDLTVTGQRLVLDEASTPPTMTMIGNVHLHGLGGVTSVEGTFSRIVIGLNKKGEAETFEGYTGR